MFGFTLRVSESGKKVKELQQIDDKTYNSGGTNY